MVDGTNQSELAREAEERWGDTDAWRQSQERTRDLGAGAQEQAKAWWEAHFAQFAVLEQDDVALDDRRVAEAVADHRALLNRFYDCDEAMQRSLAEMYVADPRFAASYDRHAPGLATYVRDAVWTHTDGH